MCGAQLGFSWTADLYPIIAGFKKLFQDFKCLGSSKVWETTSVMTRTIRACQNDLSDNQRFVDMPHSTGKAGSATKWWCQIEFHPHSLALSPTDFSFFDSKQNRGIAERIWHDSMWYTCNIYIYYIYTYKHIIHISTCISKTSTASLFFPWKNKWTVAASLKKPWKARVRSSSVQCLLKVGCAVAVLCFVSSQTDVASKTTNLMVYLPMTLYWGSKILKMHPYIQRALKANLFFKFTNKNVLLAAFWYSKLRFVWHGCVNGAGHQCNLAESTWSCFVNPARDFDGQTLGRKRRLLHEWIWLKFADDKRIDENFGQWEFWWIGHDSVDGRNPAPPGMYKPL